MNLKKDIKIHQYTRPVFTPLARGGYSVPLELDDYSTSITATSTAGPPTMTRAYTVQDLEDVGFSKKVAHNILEKKKKPKSTRKRWLSMSSVGSAPHDLIGTPRTLAGTPRGLIGTPRMAGTPRFWLGALGTPRLGFGTPQFERFDSNATVATNASETVFSGAHGNQDPDVNQGELLDAWYKVLMEVKVRLSSDQRAPIMTKVAKGKYVHVVEKVGKKVRIDDPVFGWIPSLKCTLERAPTYGKPFLAKFYE